MTPNTHYRQTQWRIKSLEPSGVFDGYASVFGVKDQHNDIVQPGAFSQSLIHWQSTKKWPKLLWQHKINQPIGLWEHMAEDNHGLKVRGRLLLNIQQGQEAYELLKHGVIDGLSIGYHIRDEETNSGVNHLKDLHLLEVSLVTYGANEQARINHVKHNDRNLRAHIQQATTDLNTLITNI
jgi:HK97 family phage prohead protease